MQKMIVKKEGMKKWQVQMISEAEAEMKEEVMKEEVMKEEAMKEEVRVMKVAD